MIKIFIILILLAAGNSAFAQHIHYKDNTKLTIPQEAPKDTSEAEIVTPSNECPGMDASLPVLINYVPPQIVDKFKVKFQGHVYCITSIKVSETETQYKLKVCYKGEFLIRFVDTNGKMVR